jgi:hypothetical protein
MTASEGHRSSTEAERKLESGVPSDPTATPDEHSAALHPAFYIAYYTSLHDPTRRMLTQKQAMDHLELECHPLQ